MKTTLTTLSTTSACLGALALGSLVGTAGPASAAATCHGLAATIAPAPGTDTVTGTAGDDVIVATDFFLFDSLGGDDTLCLSATQGAEREVSAGDGDDWVSFTAGGPGTEVYLGDGSDTYLGSEGRDRVHAEGFVEESDGPVGSSGIDVIRTFGGDDMVWTGNRSLPNNDVVDLGAGSDSLRWEGDAGGAPTLVGGAGRDRMDVSNGEFGGRSITLDLRGAQGEIGGVRFGTWTSFEDASIEHLDGRAFVVGTQGPEHIDVFATKGSHVKALSGRDVVRLNGCGTVLGGKGPDRLSAQSGCRSGVRLVGGRGSDRLQGGTRDDRLIGGPGRDAAYGDLGIDLCRAEKKRSCER